MKDDKPKALPLPSASDAEPDARGGPSEHDVAEFRRRLEVHQPAQATATNAVHAARRRQLITGIHAIDRAKPNIAIEGIIGGALGGTILQVLIYGVRLWHDSRSQRGVVESSAAKPAVAGRGESLSHAERDAAKDPSRQPTGGNP